MDKKKAIIIISATLVIASLGFYFYKKQKVKALNEKVDSLEDALKQLQEAKDNS